MSFFSETISSIDNETERRVSGSSKSVSVFSSFFAIFDVCARLEEKSSGYVQSN